MAILNQTTYSAMLKRMYPSMRVQNLAVRKHPFLDMVKKADDNEGEDSKAPFEFGLPAGGSATLSNAITNSAATSSAGWVYSQKALYQVVKIAGLTLHASRSAKGAWFKARVREIDNAFKRMGRDLAMYLFRDGWGALAQVSTTVAPSTTTVTLENSWEARNFLVNDEIVFGTDNLGTTIRAGSVTVNGVNPATPSLTTDNVSAVTGESTSDYLFLQGSAGDATTRLLPTGLAGWIPLTAESSGTFFGVSRTDVVEMKQGHRLNDTAASIETNIQKICEEIVSEGGDPDTVFLSHLNYSKLARGAQSKAQRVEGRGLTIGYKGIKLTTSAGEVDVFPDPSCPGNRGYALQMDTWCLHHLEDLFHIYQDDGQLARRGSTSDEIESWLRSWSELICSAPGYNGVFAI